ncbi:MAG TPA: PEP/pyruvate-binding domain-containing protein, partial [Chloroflexota bacterium]|nr:PEP/pyruvate-binding domain-containing protein [Chloroflexota bacterium]
MSTFTNPASAAGPLLDWDGAADSGPAVAGGKGWNLGRLARYGLPVPDGFVLGADTYRAHMKEAGLEADAGAIEQRIGAEGALADGVEAALAALRERVATAPLPTHAGAALQSALLSFGATPLAVRSSATAEDAPDASFAGMHGTVLNVRPELGAVADAVRSCYASLWTAHAVTYRQRHGLDGVAMAVVVMRLVAARTAGVAFTADPRTGRRDQVIVTANHGLGESVVSGATDPDEYTMEGFIDRPPAVVSRRVGRKERRTETVGLDEGGGTRLVDAPTAAR